MEDPIDLIFAAFALGPDDAGTTRIARLCGWPVTTVHAWKGMENIPVYRRAEIVRAAYEAGIELPKAALDYLDPERKVEPRLVQSGPYPDSPGHRGVDTSVEAADAIAPRQVPLQRQVLRTIVAAGEYGATTNEIAAKLEINRDSIQPRTSELRSKMLIMDSGERRKNANGKNAIVWTAQPAGITEAAN